jgi:NADH:ubiquinone oxidoreductase subunit 6 (subunit J)
MGYNFPSELQTYVDIADAAFILFAAIAVVGGIIAVGAKQLIHAVLGLVLSLFGVAGLYVYLGNQFIAAMQILIYVGAVAISLVFAVMLARPPREMAAHPMRLPAKIAAGALVGLFAAVIVGRPVVQHLWRKADTVTNAGTIPQVGEVLLTRYMLAFELISVVLLVAIIGSVVVAKRGRGTPQGGGQ